MLMEDRVEIPDLTENVDNFDLEKVCNVKPWVLAVKKRSSGSGGGSSGGGVKRKLDSEERNEGRKKSKKLESWSSVSSGKKIKEAGVGQRGNEGGSSGEAMLGGNGVPLKLNGDVMIPKRPRDLVRRKKVEVGPGAKQEGVTTSGASLGDGGGSCNGNSDGDRKHDVNGKFSQNGDCEGVSSDGVVFGVKGSKDSDDHVENRCVASESLDLKREESQPLINNGDAVTKKGKRIHKRKKRSRFGVAEEAKNSGAEASRICDDSQDDEENLEANAARMLSSRFDPSCTGYCFGGKIANAPFTNGLSSLISTGVDFATAYPNSGEVASTDVGVLALRARDQQNGKGVPRERRNYYEVLSTDVDSYWVLNRRIKVFWPLDKRWYFGYVTGYDSEKKLHQVKYDDREEEWIDLQNERFKLLLFPSEVPGKVGSKRSKARDKHSRKEKSSESIDKDYSSNNITESEPIISWLARSSIHKSPPVGLRKKQRTVHDSAEPQSLVNEGRAEPMGSSEAGFSGWDMDKLACSSVLTDKSGDSRRDLKPTVEKMPIRNNKCPIVYSRRRFQKRENQSTDIFVRDLCQLSNKVPLCKNAPDSIDSFDLGADMLHSMVKYGQCSRSLRPDEYIWNTDDAGCLKLIVPVSSLKVFRFLLSFPSSFVDNNVFGRQSYNFMAQHGTLVSVWPIVRLEMLFVDNAVGLRFLLFEDCLKQTVFFVFLVLSVFQSHQQENHVDQQFPVTSIRFRLSGLYGIQKQLVFAFYNFVEIADSKWSYLDRKLRKHCVVAKQLPPSDCTYHNIKALRNGCLSPLTTVSGKQSSVMSKMGRPKQHEMTMSSQQSALVKMSQVTCDSGDNHEKTPLFSLSFAAAPPFFIALHLKLLMKRSISSSSFGEQDPASVIDNSVNDSELSMIVNSENDSELFDIGPFAVKEESFRSSLPVGPHSGDLINGTFELDPCPNSGLLKNASSLGPEGVAAEPLHCTQVITENEADMSECHEHTTRLLEIDHRLRPVEPLNKNMSPVDTEGKCVPMAGMVVEVPSLVSEKVVDAEAKSNQLATDSTLSINDEAVSSPTPTPSSRLRSRTFGDSSPSASTCLSPAWSDKKPDYFRNGFGNGPKKPRTQVSYSLAFGGYDHNSKNRFHNGKGFSHRRIRKASEKKSSEAHGTLQRNMESLFCDVNVLVMAGDRGWRDCGARVVLELVDHEWRLAVKISGDTKYSYKALQFLQPGTTNRFTHAMMWKGEKDWILEFTDRSQWTIFKEMHAECYKRNVRAASVKNIPIPGVRPIDENDEIVPEVPYMRLSSKYYRQLESDVDIAMDPSHVLYDMDSDDERWVMRRRGLDFNEKGCGDVSFEMFEKIMDTFEKFAYAKQRDHFSLDELEEGMAGLGPLDAVIVIYEHWREKRQRKGMPLIRHLQPPLWEKYQQQVKEWEQGTTKSNYLSSNGYPGNSVTIERPQMFAFCLKPRGLEIPNRGSKQRSQKKLPVGTLSNGVPVDSESFHPLVGQRLNGFTVGDDRVVYSAYQQGTSDSSPVLQGSSRVFSPMDGVEYFSINGAEFDRNHYTRLYRNKSKKRRFVPPFNDHHAFASYGQGTLGKRSAGHLWNMSSSEWPSQFNYQSNGFQRHSFEQLDPSELDEFRLRDAASAARHAVTIAKMKRENAQRMHCRADLAMHKAVSAIMTAEAVKASYEEPNHDI